MQLSVGDIESAILHLPQSELEEFVAWLEEFLAGKWDTQIEDDVRSGRLDALIQQVEREIEA